MRHPPEDDYDRKEIEKIKPAPWMLELLDLNPDYCCWGPYEDYMAGRDKGWRSPCFFDSWEDFEGWELDDLNELVNFYFEVERPTEECHSCGGNGYNPETSRIYQDRLDSQHHSG